MMVFTRSLTRTRRCGGALVLALATVAASALGDDGLPDGYGVVLPSGSSVRADISSIVGSEDIDDYIVRVEAGRTLSVTVAAAPRSDLIPAVELIRSDGSVQHAAVATASGRVRIKVPAGPTETWKIRVRGHSPDADVGPTNGAYSVSVSVGGGISARARNAVPDVNGQYRFTIPAQGGARITARLRFHGAAPEFFGLTSPGGGFVEGVAVAIRARRGVVTLDRFRVPDGLPFGDYALTFNGSPAATTDVNFDATVAAQRVPPRRSTLSPLEPWIVSVSPAVGAAGSALTISAQHVEDGRPGSHFRLAIGGVDVPDAQLQFVDTFRPPMIVGTVPAGVPLGLNDVVLETATGQVAVLVGGYRQVVPPQVTGFTPLAVPAIGGAEVTILGRDFRPGRMGVRIDGKLAAITPIASTTTTVRFVSPPSEQGEYSVGVVDLDTNRISDIFDPMLQWAPWAALSSATPNVVTVLGGDTIMLDGWYFTPSDVIRLETTTPGVYETLPATYVNTRTHTITAPVRPKGRYRLVVDDGQGHLSQSATITYFSFSDVTANSAPFTGAGVDAASTALADFDGDGDSDLFVTQRATGVAGASSRTRVFRNDGAAGLAEVTATVFPAASAADDWRGDRVQAADITGDGFADLVLGTSDTTVPAAGRSRVRILVSELRAPGAATTDRVFRERTTDLFPAPRTMSVLYAQSGGGMKNDTDDWAALDLWVGDLDPTTDGLPDIVVTTDRTFANNYVSCTPYCASPYGGGYAYNMYWGGTRVFRWNPTARSGLGRYKLDTSLLPREARLPVWIFGAPPGTYTLCNTTTPCAGTFTPFTGRRLAVGMVDGDAKPDIAVLADVAPIVRGTPRSVLQVALSRAAANAYPKMNDATNALTALGADFRSDALAIGRTGWPDGAGLGLIALARFAPGAPPQPGSGPASSLRLLRYVQATDPLVVGTFEDVSSQILPATDPAALGESWQADALRFADVDLDGNDDLVLLSRAAPAGTSSGLRILRNVSSGPTKGLLVPFASTLIDVSAGATPIAGDVLTIGDIDGNGLLDFVTSRSSPTGVGPATRIVATER
ncbi:MAG: FG-GAP-like repeat-containing protein [Planctomycetes bacterium]|nr:FG-GAP-like repeat-containing protein [Planctomycetota bacterium]